VFQFPNRFVKSLAELQGFFLFLVQKIQFGAKFGATLVQDLV